MAYIEERRTKSGKTSYRVMIRMKGYPTACATFTRRTDATAWAKQTEVEMQQGRYFKHSAARKHTVADLIERYLEMLTFTVNRRHSEAATMLGWWKNEIGYLMLSDLTASVIVEKIEKLRSQTRLLADGRIFQRSPARVNRYVTALSHACTIAVNEWEWLEANPVKRIKKLREPAGRVRFLDDDERTRLLNACKSKPMLYCLVVLALSTGMRQGELLGLRWPDIDFQRQTIILHKTKNGERRVVPLTGHALEVLREANKIRRIDSDLVFPGPRQPKERWNCRGAWLAAVEAAGLIDFHFHDLRHCAASYMAMNGATLLELQAVMGHKTLQMVKRYAHLSEAHTRGVVASMNEKIFKAASHGR